MPQGLEALPQLSGQNNLLVDGCGGQISYKLCNEEVILTGINRGKIVSYRFPLQRVYENATNPEIIKETEIIYSQTKNQSVEPPRANQ